MFYQKLIGTHWKGAHFLAQSCSVSHQLYLKQRSHFSVPRCYHEGSQHGSCSGQQLPTRLKWRNTLPTTGTGRKDQILLQSKDLIDLILPIGTSMEYDKWLSFKLIQGYEYHGHLTAWITPWLIMLLSLVYSLCADVRALKESVCILARVLQLSALLNLRWVTKVVLNRTFRIACRYMALSSLPHFQASSALVVSRQKPRARLIPVLRYHYCLILNCCCPSALYTSASKYCTTGSSEWAEGNVECKTGKKIQLILLFSLRHRTSTMQLMLWQLCKGKMWCTKVTQSAVSCLLDVSIHARYFTCRL